MLTYSKERFKRVESTKDIMLCDLARFLLDHTKEDDAEIYKRTRYIGNVKEDRYCSDPDAYPFGPEFIIRTEHFYGRVEVEWWNTEEAEKKYFRENN